MTDLIRETPVTVRIGLGVCLALLVAGCNYSGAPEGAKITTTGEGQPSYSQTTSAESSAYAAPATGPTYTVVPGDTVYGVAQRMNVTTQQLVDANNLQPPYRLKPGQQLVAPGSGNYDPDLAVTTTPAAGSTYGNSAANGDTYTGSPPRVTTSTGGSIAMEELSPAAGGTNTSTRATAATTAPAATQSAETALPPPPVEDETQSDLPLTPTVKPAPADSAASAAETQEVAAIPGATTSDDRFQWPLQGKIISRFGAKNGGQHNDGINIAAKEGAKVFAADGGTVAYAGNELKGFGNLLLIRHADGWITAYAHNEKLLVKKGDKVTRGQPIALVGATGNVDSPQLHFEIRRGSDPVDPLQHLASQG
jgi:murein DD-endopeptidase MepM/ murein hydrolase activator NlpD